MTLELLNRLDDVLAALDRWSELVRRAVAHDAINAESQALRGAITAARDALNNEPAK